MKKTVSLFLAMILLVGTMGNIVFAAEESNVVAYFPLYGDYQFKDVVNDGAELVPPSDGNAIVGDEYLSLHRNESAGNPDNTGHLVSDYPNEKITGDQVSFSFSAKVDANQTRTPSSDEANLRTIFMFGSSDYSKNCITLRYYYSENASAVVLVNNGQDSVVAIFQRPLEDMWHNYSIALDGSSGGKLTVYVDGEKAAEVDSKGIGADEIGCDTLRLNRATSSNTINVDSCYRDLRFIKGIITEAQAQQYTSDIEALAWKELQDQSYVTDGMKVRENIDLPISNGVTWKSSDESTINPNTGAVTRPEYGSGEKAVTLTLCWKSYTKDYTVYVLPIDAGDSVVTSFDFDSYEVGSKIEHVGTAAYALSMDGYGQAADITGDFYMQVNAENGGALLSSVDAVTVSYDSKTTAPSDGNAEIVCVTNSVTGGKIAVTDNGETVKISAGASEFEAAATGEWKKVIASFSDSELRLYIDGELVIDEVGTFEVKSALGVNSAFYLGLGGAGLVDNVYVFNRALSVEEINEYFVANVAPVMNVTGGSENYPNDIYEPISITHPAGNDVIYYTLDGTEPTTSSTKYTGAFYAGNAHIIACAISPAGVKSGTVEAYVYNQQWAATAAEFRIEGENTVNNAKIGWPLYPNATSYEVYRGDVYVGTATGDGLEDYDLEINKNYTYTVKALNGDEVIAVGTTNTIMTFAVDLDDITGYDDNVNGGYVSLITSDPSPSGYEINGKYYSVSLRGVSRDDFVAAGFDGEIWDNTCSVTSICYKESDDGLTWPDEWTLVYPIFVDMRLEGSHNDLHNDGETIVFSAHAEGTSGYGAAKLFFASFKPGRDDGEVAPYGVTVSGGLILSTDDPWEQYETIENPASNQVSSYYVGRPFGYDSRDMVRFIDNDGTFYTFSATAMNQDMLILKLDENWTMPEKVMNVILKGQRQESPSVFHDGDAYYIYTSTANGWFSSQARYASSYALDEPWSPLREIANSGTFATQANGVWGYGSASGRVVQRGHGYNWGQSGGWRATNYQRYWHMAINEGVATGAWCSKLEYHPYWGAIAVQSGQLVSLGKKATAEGKDAPYLTDNTQLQSSEVTEIQNLPYDIIVDLEVPTVITEVNLTNDLYIGSTCGSYFYVYGSNDQNTWTMLADETGDDDDDPAFRNAWIEDDTPYRYVKVTVTAVKNLQNNSASALWGGKPLELAIYGKPEGYVDETYEFTDEILVGYDRKNIDFEPYGQSPVIVNDRTLVPLRAIFEAMGATVDWDAETQTVTATRDDTTISLTINSDQLYVNGEAVTIDTPAQIINDRTMVPVRAIAESFGCEVDWNEDARRVYITEAE